ncbi:hypothetical protein [Brevibacillus sp. NRS-1366]|uniref:hypothetical protein n=1 Tax=Brevibacillus sp. NRS-1366 TaxID=3233899 RepID=UPI003D1F5F91
MLQYTFDETLIGIKEIVQLNDVAFQIQVRSDEMRNRLKQVRQFFEDNKDFTDVFFYSQEDGTYEVIVRSDIASSFLIHCFRFQCLTSLRWA